MPCGLQNIRYVYIYGTDIATTRAKIHVALMRTPAIASDVHNTTWQQRLRATGLTQKEFARLVGLAENTVSRQMRGEWEMPLYVKALILALDVMGEKGRAKWLAELKLKGKD